MTEYTNNGQRTRYAIIDGKRVPLDYKAARALSLNAHLLALGDPKRAAQMVAEAERAKRMRPKKQVLNTETRVS